MAGLLAQWGPRPNVEAMIESEPCSTQARTLHSLDFLHLAGSRRRLIYLDMLGPPICYASIPKTGISVRYAKDQSPHESDCIEGRHQL